MKKLFIFIVISLVFNIICLSYNTKDYSSLSKYNSKYEFVDFNKYLSTVKTKREKYFRITEFVDSYMEYGNIKKDISCILKKGMPFNYIIEDNKDTVCLNSFADMHKYYLHKTIRVHKGVCEDYTALFKHICKQNNLPCQEVSGFAKNSDLNLGMHSWIVADSFIIDPTFCDANMPDTIQKITEKLFDCVISKNNVDTFYFDIDPTIAAYTYFPLNNDVIICLQFRLWEKYTKTQKTMFLDSTLYKFNSSVGVHVSVMKKCNFDIPIDTNQPTLTHKRLTYKEFISLPYITQKHAISQIVDKPYTVRDTVYVKTSIITKKMVIKKHVEIKKELVVYIKLIDLEPIKCTKKESLYVFKK